MQQNTVSKKIATIQFLGVNWRDYIERESCTKEELIKLLESHGVQSQFLQKEYSNGKFLYIQSAELGISFQLESGILNCIFLYGPCSKSFSPFNPDHLPAFLLAQWKTKFTEIVALLGEPQQKSGGGVTQVAIAYDRLGIEFTFGSKVWTDQQAGLDFITLFKRDTSPTSMQCGICKTNTSQLCARCNIVYYCNSECQKQHFKLHKQSCIAFAALP